MERDGERGKRARRTERRERTLHTLGSGPPWRGAKSEVECVARKLPRNAY